MTEDDEKKKRTLRQLNKQAQYAQRFMGKYDHNERNGRHKKEPLETSKMKNRMSSMKISTKSY